MTLLNRIPLRYFELIPAIYFAGLGTVCAVMDLVNGSGSWFFYALYTLLLIPLVFRRARVYKIFGAGAAGIFGYLMLALTLWLVQYVGGTPFREPMVTFGVGYLFTGFSFLCALSLIHAGITRSQTTKTIQSTI